LRETAFASGGAQRYAVEENLCSRCAEQHTAAATIIQSVAQFFPRGLKLLRSFHVSEFVQTREFEQDVQAADKSPRPASGFGTHIFPWRLVPSSASL